MADVDPEVVLIIARFLLSCSFPARHLFGTRDPTGQRTDRRDVKRMGGKRFSQTQRAATAEPMRSVNHCF